MFIRFADTLLRHARAFLMMFACLIGVSIACLHLTSTEENALETARDIVLRRPGSGQVVLVQIDAKSIERIHAWPWPRQVHARLVNMLQAAGAKRVVFDIDFTSPATDPRQDKSFAAAIARFEGKVILPGSFEPASSGSDEMISSLPTTALAAHAQIGNIYVEFEHGIVRKFNYSELLAGRIAPSLASYLADRKDLPRAGSFAIDWSIDPNSIPSVSYSDVLDGKVDPSFFRGRMVIVGATANTMGDHYSVPVFNTIPGVYVDIIASETLRRGIPTPIGQTPLLIFALAIVGLACMSRRGLIRMSGLVICAAAIFVVPLALRWSTPIVIESVAALATVLAAIVAQGWLWITGAIVRRITLASGSQLPNMLAMSIQPQPHGLSVAVRLRNHVETTALLGHAAQAELLRRVHERLELATEGAHVYQVDERSFAWRTSSDIERTADVIEGLYAVFAAGIPIGTSRKQTIDTTISVGLCDDPAIALGESVANAMLAADQAVEQGVRWARFVSRDEEDDWRLTLLGEVDRAIDNADLWVAYQPKIELRTGAVTGAEALVRWTHPERGFIAPDRFIPIVEENGRIDRLTFYVLEHAIRDFATLPELKIAVNLSMRLLGRTQLVGPIKEILDRYGMAPSRLTLEITESASMTGPDGLAELERLRALGIAISIDDYGTGQSTLSYLQKLPATELKIDRSFVQLILASRSDWTVVDSTIKLAHALGLSVVAEGVETQEIMDALTKMECDEQQGYFTGRPMPFAKFTQHLSRSKVAQKGSRAA